MTLDHRVFVPLKRPPGYEDAHAELVVEDAMRQDRPWKLLRDEVTAVVVVIGRPEGYERSSATEVAKGAVKETWPMWPLLKRSKHAPNRPLP
jgi:hypothetical protein